MDNPTSVQNPNPIDLSIMAGWKQYSPEARGEGEVKNWVGEAMPNRFGCRPVRFENTDERCRTPGPGCLTTWVEFVCGEEGGNGGSGCGERFWSAEGVGKVKRCQKCEIERGGSGRKPKLDLEGLVFGALEVKEYVRGAGWRCVCDCGRGKIVPSRTALKKGYYQSCGKCNMQERREGSGKKNDEEWAKSDQPLMLDPRLAPPSALRASGVADHKLGQLILKPMVFEFCLQEHEAYGVIAHVKGEDCPLCLALARLELQGGTQ